MRVLPIVFACLVPSEILAKKSSRRGTSSASSSRSSNPYASSTRKPKFSYADWDKKEEEDNYEEDYFAQEDYRSNRSSRLKEDFDDDNYTFTTKRPQQKRKSRPTEEQVAARSEGTFSGAGKGPLYDAYNQLHTLAQVRSERERCSTRRAC